MSRDLSVKKIGGIFSFIDLYPYIIYIYISESNQNMLLLLKSSKLINYHATN